jgi:hypothetical protein
MLLTLENDYKFRVFWFCSKNYRFWADLTWHTKQHYRFYDWGVKAWWFLFSYRRYTQPNISTIIHLVVFGFKLTIQTECR